MARTIWKYPFETTDYVSLTMPQGAEILAVQTQRDQPCMWALIDDLNPMMRRDFRVFGTGHDVDVPGNYIGTYQQHGGDLIFHVFEV